MSLRKYPKTQNVTNFSKFINMRYGSHATFDK